MYKIGVFDSGVGGHKVVAAIREAIADVEIVFKDDKKNLPYGNKTPEQILDLMTPIIHQFIDDSVDAIVIACNTASTNVLEDVKQLVDVPVVGFIPMIKPAVKHTDSGVVTVCATPGTLKSKKYAQLKEEFGQGVKFIEPDCSDWAELIEQNSLNEQKISEVIEIARGNNSDVVVLACTHYHWIEDLLDELSGPKIKVMQPTSPVINELKIQIGLD